MGKALISVFLVDDMSLVRTGIKLILGTTPNIKVIGEADPERKLSTGAGKNSVT